MENAIRNARIRDQKIDKKCKNKKTDEIYENERKWLQDRWEIEE